MNKNRGTRGSKWNKMEQNGVYAHRLIVSPYMCKGLSPKVHGTFKHP